MLKARLAVMGLVLCTSACSIYTDTGRGDGRVEKADKGVEIYDDRRDYERERYEDQRNRQQSERADERRLEELVYRELRKLDYIDTRGVRVRAAGDDVYLSGEVETWRDRDDVVDAVRRIREIRRVYYEKLEVD